MRRVLIVGAAVVGLLALLGALRLGDHDAIARTQAAAARLAAHRDSLLAVVARDEAARDTLVRLRDVQQHAITTLRDSVATLERDRADAQLSLRQIRTTGALMDRFRAAFPALGDSAAGITTLPLVPDDTLGLEVLMVPAFFAETFLLDHQNAMAWRAQRDGLLVVDSLHATVATLQDSITRLALAERHAFQTGYDAALQAYGALNTRHLAELRKPRVHVGSVWSFLLGAGTAVLAVELAR